MVALTAWGIYEKEQVWEGLERDVNENDKAEDPVNHLSNNIN